MASAISRFDVSPSPTGDANETPYRQMQNDSGQHPVVKDQPPSTFSAKIRADMISKINEIQSWFVGRHPAQ